jgi:hypothetical protein
LTPENFSADSENIIADVVINTRYDKDLDINGLVIKFDNKELEVISVLLENWLYGDSAFTALRVGVNEN